jgi:hypothetical protein
MRQISKSVEMETVVTLVGPDLNEQNLHLAGWKRDLETESLL